MEFEGSFTFYDSKDENPFNNYGEIFIIPFIQCIIILVVAAYLLWGYADRKRTPIFFCLVVLVAWFFSFSVIVFIPLDIFLS